MCLRFGGGDSSVAKEGDIILFLLGMRGGSFESVRELAVKAHGLAGGFQALCVADIA
jgi:hypothetical protein